MKYFFDTYALVELTRENENYLKYKDEIMTTSILNIGELYLACLRLDEEETGEKWCSRLQNKTLEINVETMKKAMKFKFENKKKNFSFVDCVSYVVAKENGMVFLTGDKEFENIDNVEFVK